MYTPCHKFEVRAKVKQVKTIANLAASGYDTPGIIREHLNNQDLGPFWKK
jgi:hypothetical protein